MFNRNRDSDNPYLNRYVRFLVDLDRTLMPIIRTIPSIIEEYQDRVLNQLMRRNLQGKNLNKTNIASFRREVLSLERDRLLQKVRTSVINPIQNLAVRQVEMGRSVFNGLFENNPFPRMKADRSRSIINNTDLLGSTIENRLTMAMNNNQSVINRILLVGALSSAPLVDLLNSLRSTGSITEGTTPFNSLARRLNLDLFTYSQSSINTARFNFFRANKNLIDQYQHISVLDGRTSVICIARAGARWNADDLQPIGHRIIFEVPPLHPNCRSTLIPIFKSPNEIGTAARVLDQFRNDIGGDRGFQTSYSSFLRSQPVAVAREILGKEKYALFLAGTLTLRQLLDNSGRPLTLDQLERRYL